MISQDTICWRGVLVGGDKDKMWQSQNMHKRFEQMWLNNRIPFHSLANTVGTLPPISTNVLLFLTQASSPLRPFSTPTPLCFHPPTAISAGDSPHVFTHVMPA